MAVRVEGIDEAWLERAAARDPVAHAYAVWDLRHERAHVRFVSCREGNETLAYRLEWRGGDHPPILHWVGTPLALPLFEGWPERPFVAVVPPEVVEEFRRRRGPIDTFGVDLRSLHGPLKGSERTRPARRLTMRDRAALDDLIARESDRLVSGYREIDLDRIPVFGAFEDGHLVAVAKAGVALPSVWLLAGIVTAGRYRNRGFGRAVTVAATRAALQVGARPALFVRADNTPAVRIYESLGFERDASKVWIDAGAHWVP